MQAGGIGGVQGNGKIYAVLTGDLVKSSRLTSDKSLGAMHCLREAAALFAQQHPGTVVGSMDTFRHDSWQLLLETPSLAMRAAVFLRAALKLESDASTKYDTRLSIGIGKVELISEPRISNSRGEAFTFSGKGLDAMNGQNLALLAGKTAPAILKSIENGVIPLLDCVIGDWTPTESRAVYGALKGWTQAEIANGWPPDTKTGKRISRQAVSDSLARAHWNVVEAVLLWIELQLSQVYRLA